MEAKKRTVKMPELLVFARTFIFGFIVAETFRAMLYLTEPLAEELRGLDARAVIAVSFAVLLLCFVYLLSRGAFAAIARIALSGRVDLLAAMAVGIWSNQLALPFLSTLHGTVTASEPMWAGAVLLFLCAVLLSPFAQQLWPRRRSQSAQFFFMADDEISEASEDLLASGLLAKQFAETVIASRAHAGLVFGIDGPWGVGKTSFINLAQRHWEGAADQFIVCRFEPLRYATEPDLADRLIRDLSAAIQSKVFAPEFRPAASRYSRLIRGKADVSFLGFKLSLEPSQETVDELLDDIDEVLLRIGRRVIIVIDDLDRLDAKTTNSVLFATRRTFRLTQATYVLCYDTEVLTSSKDDGARAREFLEKFVTAKLSLFVDSSSLRDYLRRDWELAENQLGSVPSDTLVKLGAILTELAEILDGDLAASYLPLVGDLRKVKRFINSLLLVQIEKTDLGRTDFNKRDLINLMLLYLHFPALFRRIYAEETEGRSGSFSVCREFGEPQFKNADGLKQLIDSHEGPAAFLLEQLFDVQTLSLGARTDVDEATLRSRACFNLNELRNLESYLKLIVRFATPEPQATFVMYQEAVTEVKNGAKITSVLEGPDFTLSQTEKTHDQFWSLLVNQSHDFQSDTADDAIETLVGYLPRYSAFDHRDRGLRDRSIYSLLRLLDRAGWGRTKGRQLANTAENIVEIAWRVFGEGKYEGKGLLQRLASPDRGVLGWHDLMLFRLQCSADRQGQLSNLHSALIVHQDKTAETTGLLSTLALKGMRKLSQEVFALFKQNFIESQRNFLAEANDVPAANFLGEAFAHLSEEASRDPQAGISGPSISWRIAAARTAVKSFVIYQLCNAVPPKGAGVGCGHYDEAGTGTSSGIAKAMNDYMFGVCFNPEVEETNVYLFLDHCLAHLSHSMFSDLDQEGYVANKFELPGGLDSIAIATYWQKHRDRIRGLNLHTSERRVITPAYSASYSDDLDSVFTVLDELVDASREAETDLRH